MCKICLLLTFNKNRVKLSFKREREREFQP